MTVNLEAAIKTYDASADLHLVGFLQNPQSREIYQSLAVPAGTLPGAVTTAIGENIGHRDVRVYPNPCQQQVNISLAGFNKSDVQISLFNESGVRLMEKRLASGSTGTLNLHAFKAGVYILQITDGENIEHRKVVKL